MDLDWIPDAGELPGHAFVAYSSLKILSITQNFASRLGAYPAFIEDLQIVRCDYNILTTTDKIIKAKKASSRELRRVHCNFRDDEALSEIEELVECSKQDLVDEQIELITECRSDMHGYAIFDELVTQADR